MPHESSFGVTTAAEFLTAIVIPQYEAFLADNSSPRHALLTALVAYHLYEWVQGKKFSVDRFRSACPGDALLADSFEAARHICNGTKHFKSKPVTTRTQRGFSSGFSDAFARPLVVVMEDGSEQSADSLLREIVEFWKGQHNAGAF